MATMITEVYEAFRKVGIPDPEAKHAAEALSAENVSTKADINGAEKRLGERISREVAALDDKLSLRINDLDEKLSDRMTALDDKLSPKIAQTGARHGRDEMDDGDNHSRYSLPYRGCRLHCDQALFLSIKILPLTPSCAPPPSFRPAPAVIYGQEVLYAA